MIQAIFFDVDGTLVSFRTHTIPASTLEALHAPVSYTHLTLPTKA